MGKIRMLNPEIRYKCGNANRGKIFSTKRKQNMSKGKKGIGLGRKATKETKIKIGIASKAKFTSKFKNKFRKTMENNGHWIPLKQKRDNELYFKQADWIERMFDKINLSEKKLLKQYGIFNAKTNTIGVVRDHKYSRKSGFENKIPPELLRHPCNCEIILHKHNVSKKSNRYRDADSLSLSELFNDIKKYKREWIEQDLCLKLIKEYNNE